jgi:glutamine synthetase
MSANFYLSSAFSLRAGLDGLDKGSDPGQPLNDNLYLESASRSARNALRRLPRTLLEAIEALETSSFAKDSLGEEFVNLFVAQKKKEWDMQFYTVTSAEREKYLAFI